jgi:hypothetical protein
MLIKKGDYVAVGLKKEGMYGYCPIGQVEEVDDNIGFVICLAGTVFFLAGMEPDGPHYLIKWDNIEELQIFVKS